MVQHVVWGITTISDFHHEDDDGDDDHDDDYEDGDDGCLHSMPPQSFSIISIPVMIVSIQTWVDHQTVGDESRWIR